MKNVMHRIGILLLLCAVLPVHAAQWLPKPSKISPSVWVWIGPYEAPSQTNRGYRMNLGFVVGTQAVAVIDSGYSPDMATEMLSRIREITPLPVRYVINTNSQSHRFMGNEVFRQAGAEIIVASEAVTRMENEGAEFAATVARTLGLKESTIQPPQLPHRKIEKAGHLTLDLGGDTRLVVRDFGRAHTRGSLVVEVPSEQTVFAGDILYGGRLLAVLPDSHTVQWAAAYDALRGLKAKRFVPGHGEVGPLKQFEFPTYRYLVSLRAHMDNGVKAGRDADAAIKGFDSAPWKKLANFDELAGRNASLTFLEAEAEGF